MTPKQASEQAQSQPATAAGHRALEWIAMTEVLDDPSGNTIYDEMRLNFIPAIEAEAAAPDVTIMRKAMLDLDRILPGPKPRYSWPTAAQIVAAYERARLMRERQP